jgi:hypothetical protein
MIGLCQKSALGRAGACCFISFEALAVEGASVTHSVIELDAETLRRCLRLGGLEVSAERAATLLPVVSALLAGCERLTTLDLANQGGCGPEGGRGD